METMCNKGVLNNNKGNALDLLIEKIEMSINNANEVIVAFATEVGEVRNSIIIENYEIAADALEITSKDFEISIDIDAALIYEDEIYEEFVIEILGTELHLQFL